MVVLRYQGWFLEEKVVASQYDRQNVYTNGNMTMKA